MTSNDMCWFCKIRPVNPGSSLKVKMRKQIGKTRKEGVKTYISNWQTLELIVPRCTVCMRHHRNTGSWNFLIGLALIGPILIGFLIPPEIENLGSALKILIPIAGVILGLGLCILLVLRMLKLSRGAKNEEYKLQYPPIKEQLKEPDWQVD